MVKPNSTVESTDYIVFINTNLETHLALVISNNDTVSQLKQKVQSEHLTCFPSLGKIDVDAIKVKRKKCFYHLSDSLCVKSVFDGVNGTWYLYVDAVSQVVSRENPLHLEPGSADRLAEASQLKKPPAKKQQIKGKKGEDVCKNVICPSGEACQPVLAAKKDDIVPENLLLEEPLGDEQHVKSDGLSVKQVESLVSEEGKKKKEPSIREEATSTVAPSEEIDLKRKLSEASLDTEAKDVANTRKKKMMLTKISDGENGFLSSGAGKDDSTKDADHPSLETKKAGKSLPPTGKSMKSKAKNIVAPSSCLEKRSDKDCGIGDNSVNMESLKTKQSTSENKEKPPKEHKVAIFRDLNSSTDENRKHESIPLKKVKKARTRKATSDNNLSKNLPEDGKSGRTATKNN